MLCVLLFPQFVLSHLADTGLLCCFGGFCKGGGRFGGLQPASQAILADNVSAMQARHGVRPQKNLTGVAVVTAPAIGPTLEVGSPTISVCGWNFFFINIRSGALSLFLTSFILEEPTLSSYRTTVSPRYYRTNTCRLLGAAHHYSSLGFGIFCRSVSIKGERANLVESGIHSDCMNGCRCRPDHSPCIGVNCRRRTRCGPSACVMTAFRRVGVHYSMFMVEWFCWAGTVLIPQ